MTIANNIKTSFPQTASILELLKAVEDRFTSADKSLPGMLMAELTIMKYDCHEGVQQNILNMTNKAAKLDALEMHIYDLSLCNLFSTHFLLSLVLSKFTITLIRTSGV